MDNIEVKKKTIPKGTRKVLNILFLVFFLYVGVHYLSLSPYSNTDVLIHVSKNTTLTTLAIDLKKREVIQYPFVFKTLVFLLDSDRNIKTGDYLFKRGIPVYKVAYQVAYGVHGVSPIKVTFPEGYTNIQMADTLASKLAGFRRDLFLDITKDKQGYLYPDTYFFYPLSTVDEIVEAIENNFNNQISKLQKDFDSSDRSREDIITMASILEEEANGEDDIEMISGILWKRISIGMPLQVDVYRPSYYNTGLAPSPISNPSIVSIKASLYPKENPYLYYLHDKNGNVHYAKTYNEHRVNISKYLR